MLRLLSHFINRPALFASSTNQFWNDEYISRFVLEAHLNPNVEEASRKPDFLDRSALWIAETAPPSQYNNLLDLGCGPGLYAERFKKIGYKVTGIDFSRRSIEYANKQSVIEKSGVNYLYQDYLTIDYDSCFDVITLIYCDFGTLSADNRTVLMQKIYKGLKPGGRFILDVFTPVKHQNKKETRKWEYYPDGGFWNEQAHLCLNSFYRYDEDNTVMNQTIVIDDNGIECYNIWEHCFTKDALLSEAKAVGFVQYELYGDISGKPFDEHGNITCAVFTK